MLGASLQPRVGCVGGPLRTLRWAPCSLLGRTQRPWDSIAFSNYQRQQYSFAPTRKSPVLRIGLGRKSVPCPSGSDDEPSVEKGEDGEEEEGDRKGEFIVVQLYQKSVKFWQAADDTTRGLLVMLLPLMWFVSQTMLWRTIASGIISGIASILEPVTSWFTEIIVKNSSYRALQIFSLPTTGKLWAVFFIGGTVTVMGATLYRLASGATWDEALGKSYFTLNNVPGMDCTGDETPQGTLVLNLIHLMSLFTFAILVGILTDDIGSAVEQVTKGNFPVPEKNHTVVVGWNSQIIPILNQVIRLHQREPDGVFSMPILILADKDKEEMDGELLEEFGSELIGKALLTRQGKYVSKADMERVAAGKARTIMFLHDEEEANDDEMGDEDPVEMVYGSGDDGSYNVPARAKLLAALANLKAIGVDERAPQNLVFQSRVDPDELHEEDFAYDYMIKSLTQADRKYNLTTVSDMKSLTDVMAQCASQPGLAAVFKKLFVRSDEPGDLSHVIVKYPSLIGKTFGEARRAFPGPVAVCGVLGSNASVEESGLNPPDDYVIQDDDRLFLVTTGDRNKVAPMSKIPEQPVMPEELVNRQRPRMPGKKYVIIAHMDDPSQLVESLIETIEQEEASSKSTITVISGNDLGRDVVKGTRKVKVKYLSGDIDRDLMVEAGVETADSVIFQLIGDTFTRAESDAQTLHTILQLHGVLASSDVERESPLGIVCNINDPEVVDVINTMVHEIPSPLLHVSCLEPDKLLGSILTQVAATPELRAVFEDLFDADGQEIYAKPLSHYGLKADGRVMRWDTLQEVTREDGDLLMGYVCKDSEVRLAIPYDTRVKLEEGDRLVVLAEDMYGRGV